MVFECDLDWPCEDIYFAYSQRWEIGVVMRYYKHALEPDQTRVHAVLSVIGSEFIDFLSSVLTFKVINFLDSRKVLEKMSYGKVIKKLSRGKKVLLKGGMEGFESQSFNRRTVSHLGDIAGVSDKGKKA